MSDVSYPARESDARWRQAPFLLKASWRDVKGKRGLAMAQMKEANVYRICADGADRWYVFQDPASEPVATFEDKAAALNYAMCLARGRVAWHLLLRQNDTAASRAHTPSGSAHH